jgi:hypothetical protein
MDPTKAHLINILPPLPISPLISLSTFIAWGHPSSLPRFSSFLLVSPRCFRTPPILTYSLLGTLFKHTIRCPSGISLPPTFTHIPTTQSTPGSRKHNILPQHAGSGSDRAATRYRRDDTIPASRQAQAILAISPHHIHTYIHDTHTYNTWRQCIPSSAPPNAPPANPAYPSPYLSTRPWP